MFDLIIKNGTCFTPNGRQQLDIGIQQGKITALAPTLAEQQSNQTIDAQNLHVLPGVIDSQVHFREPGNEHKEDLATGTMAAALGGVTAIFEMPNTNPATTSVAALNDKLQRAEGRAWCDYAFFIGGTPEDSNWHQLESLPGCSGIKIFMGSSTGNLLVEQDDAIRAILQRSQRRCAVHCEDEPRLRERKHIAEEGQHPRFHPEWRDIETAFLATQRLLKIARECHHPVHVLHVTTAKEMALLAQNKDIATVEVTPQHLTLTDSAYEEIGTFAQMNPPIRSETQQIALWEAVANGTVDVVGSDHAPHTREEKSKPYPESPAGMPGVQTLVPIMLNHVNNGKLTLERFVDLTASGPARIYNIANKGRIALGYDADFTIVDMQKRVVIDNDWIVSKCAWTPYHGMSVQGWPLHTIIRGNTVMLDGELQSQPIGEAVRFIGIV